MQPDKTPARAITEREAEQRADLADKEDAKRFYRRDFTGPSIGTEEELSGINIKMKYTSERLVGVVRKGPANLVLITRDMPVKAHEGDYREYTIELRTTPTEAPAQGPDSTEWTDRRRALQVAIWAIENYLDSPLPDDDWHGFQTTIYNSDHSFARTSQTITNSDKQATFGVPTAAIVSAGAADRATGQLHPNVLLPWYLDQFAHDPAVAGFTSAEQVAYAFLMSAALQLTRLPRNPETGAFNPYTSEAKNEWKVRPRTPPVKVVGIFQQGRQDAVKAAVNSSAPPAVTKPPTLADWQLCTRWITEGKLLGGHEPMDITINNAPGMLFEYRSAPTERYPHAFWKYAEWKPSNF
jgi:hypothetical protein